MTIAFSAGDAAYWGLAIFLVLLGIGSIFALFKLGQLFDRVSSLVSGAERDALPVVVKTGGTVDRVNYQLDKLDTVTDSAVSMADSADTAVRAVSTAITTPVEKVSGAAAGIAHGFASFRKKRSFGEAKQAAADAAQRREQDLREDLRVAGRTPPVRGQFVGDPQVRDDGPHGPAHPTEVERDPEPGGVIVGSALHDPLADQQGALACPLVDHIDDAHAPGHIAMRRQRTMQQQLFLAMHDFQEINSGIEIAQPEGREGERHGECGKDFRMISGDEGELPFVERVLSDAEAERVEDGVLPGITLRDIRDMQRQELLRRDGHEPGP